MTTKDADQVSPDCEELVDKRGHAGDTQAPMDSLNLSSYHDAVISQAGLGRFHWRLLGACAVSAAVETSELGAAPYISPSVARELCIPEEQRCWLAGVGVLGMMAGSLVWGHLADRLGRRRTLIFAMSTNAIFSAISAFMPTQGLFMAMRLCSGFGAGGTLPLVVIYWSEFLARKSRSLHYSPFLFFWALGGVVVALLAWALVPKTGLGMLDMKRLHFSSWRVLLLVLSLPVFVTTVALMSMPESPRYLMEVERDNEAVYIYQQIFKTNLTSPMGSDYQLTDVELPPRPLALRPHTVSTGKRSMLKALGCMMERCWGSSFRFLQPSHRRDFLLLGLIWFLVGLGYYGVWAWLPAQEGRVAALDYDSWTRRRVRLDLRDTTFTGTLENTLFVESRFTNVTFGGGLVLNSCTFADCTFVQCTFSDVRSSRTRFLQSRFEEVLFADTDLFPYKFVGCTFGNGTRFSATRAGCDLDFDINYRLTPALLAYLALWTGALPGVLASGAFLADRWSRPRTLVLGCILTSIAGCFLWFVSSYVPLLIFAPFYGACAAVVWAVLPLLSLETYPSNIRGAGVGTVCALGKLGVLLGLQAGIHVTSRIGVSILEGSTWLAAGLLATQLRETKDHLL